MTQDPVLHRTLEAAHHLSDATPPWGEVLEGARQLIGGDSASFVLFSRTGELLDCQQRGISAAAEQAYVDHFHAYDIVTPTTSGAPEGTWFDTAELFSPSSLSRNAYYVDFMCRHRMRQMLTLLVEQTPTRHGGLTVQRAEPRETGRRQLGQGAGAALAAAIGSAVQRRRVATEHWFAAAESAFDGFEEALCLVSRKGAVLRQSPRAQAWFARNASLRVRHGLLWHALPAMRTALHEALGTAAERGRRVALTLPGPGEAAGCQLDLAPADHFARLGNEPLLLLRIRHAPDPIDARLKTLGPAYGLTSAEQRVLGALIAGESPAAHAQSRGVSIHTVRKQIAMIKEKMGCARQVDLVRAGMSVP
ncbi:helix-turn-helix transcriptional regulator [Variovorax sp. ZT4R33]|uniref:helix-turn-helix transcriptional regulator n=1 Tax=Variovorax sp. ZT4R33 TaxID=3443743 RepID=UPI003F48F283